jgi:DNA-directed RNA polymerase specialized sigma24 family protein
MTSEEIEDCTQEAALKAILSAPPRSNPTAYYRRIGFSVAHEQVRRQRAQRRDAARTVELTEVREPPSDQASVEARLLARERLLAGLVAIQSVLPAWDFKIFALAVLGALSSAEVADQLSLTPASVDGSVSRSRRRLSAHGIHLPPRR